MPFSISNLPENLKDAMRSTGVWKPEGPLALERLALVRTSYFDFDGNEQNNGEIIVFDAAAHRALTVFRLLHQARFPIAKMRSLHCYDADDLASMADNNTSCFCDRPIEGTNLTSLHSYGLAIDLNPLQNPFISFNEQKGEASILPPQGWQYLNRHNQKPGMIEPVVSLFAEHGFFIWGGAWTTPIDLHHFQAPRAVAELLAIMSLEDGQRLFDLCAVYRAQLTQMPCGEKLEPLIKMYQADRLRFFTEFLENLAKLT